MGSIPLYKTVPSNAKQPQEDEGAVPVPKRLKLAQSPGNEVADGSDASTSAKQRNTIRSTAWAVKTFQEWKEDRNELFPGDLVPHDILDKYNYDVAPLVHWLSRFLVEARNKEGSVYSPCSLHGLLCGILRYMREKNPHTPNFMDKNDPRFKELHVLIDTTFANLREQGVRTYRKNSPGFITLEKENELWGQRIMGSNTPISLQRAVFFMMCKMFYIKGGLEHRALKPSQFTRERNPDSYTFLDMGSKTNSNQLRKVYADPSAGNRCMVYLLDLYFSKLPSYAFDKDILYLRPKSNFLPKENSSPWYEAFPVGKEKLRTMTRDMCADGGILKSTGASKVARAGSTEKRVELSNSSNASGIVPLDGTMKLPQVYQQPLLLPYQAIPASGLVSSTGGTNIPIVKVIVPDSGRQELVQLSTGQLELVQPITGCQGTLQSIAGHQASLQSIASHQASLQSIAGHQASLQSIAGHQALLQAGATIVQPSAVHQRSILPRTDHPVSIQSSAIQRTVQQVSIQPSTVHYVSIQPSTDQVSIHPSAVHHVSIQPSIDHQVSIQPSSVHHVSIQPGGCQRSLILPKTGHQASVQPQIRSGIGHLTRGISFQSRSDQEMSSSHASNGHVTSRSGRKTSNSGSRETSGNSHVRETSGNSHVRETSVEQSTGYQVSVRPHSHSQMSVQFCASHQASLHRQILVHQASVQPNNNHQTVQPSDCCPPTLDQPRDGRHTPILHSNGHQLPVQLSATPVHPSATPVQPSLSAQISKTGTDVRSLKMPRLKKRPSREHHKVISKIVSAIEMSDDPDLHCVYVCVHKSRRWDEGGKGRAAEAPF